MPQLAKGGKWVFGWAVVGEPGVIRIPPQAYEEYGFQAGEDLILLRGSRRSGGFALGRKERLAATILQPRFIARAVMGAGERVMLPPEASVRPGERLLAVRGSGLALSFLQRGPIYEEALKHPEIEIFEVV